MMNYHLDHLLEVEHILQSRREMDDQLQGPGYGDLPTHYFPSTEFPPRGRGGRRGRGGFRGGRGGRSRESGWVLISLYIYLLSDLHIRPSIHRP